MKVSDDLTALVFELQRARSPAEKARSLARAWRTVRGLSGSERRLLAREVGFDGAEDLVEGLAGKSGGAFQPAAILEALGKMRRDPSLSVVGILADLKDPDRREDLFRRGIDLVIGDDVDDGDMEDARAFDSEVAHGEDPVGLSMGGGETVAPAADEPDPVDATADGAESPEDEVVAVDPMPPPPPPAVETAVVEDPSTAESDPDSAAESKDRHGSDWDKLWLQAPTRIPIHEERRRTVEVGRSVGADGTREETGSVLHRLRVFRDGMGEIRQGGGLSVIDALETLPEPWAKRRALVALIESGIPDDAASVLDVIEGLDRPMDRRWCLSALARRGDLGGEDLERALGLLTSPAARRRVEALAGRAQ